MNHPLMPPVQPDWEFWKVLETIILGKDAKILGNCLSNLKSITLIVKIAYGGTFGEIWLFLLVTLNAAKQRFLLLAGAVEA